MSATARLLWISNRVAAGAVAAALTGTLSGIIWSLFYNFTTPRYAAPFETVVSFAAITTIFGFVFGAPSGILVVCFSRAPREPWRSLPFLLVGTTIGFFVGLWVCEIAPRGIDIADFNVAAWVVGATIGGIVATWVLPPRAARANFHPDRSEA